MFRADIMFQRYNFHLSVNLKLTPGSITALIGESGSGKSSLFRLLAGLELPQSGEIYSDGTCWFDGKKNYNLVVQQRNVGMVFQDYALFEHLTVYENIAYGVQRNQNLNAVDCWLKKINLTHKSSAYPDELSGGEKQRVALARALVPEPDILLLDEPFSALDISIRHDLRRELQALISDMQIPVLIATHDLFEARILADSVYVMEAGHIIRHGATSDVFQSPCTVQAAKVLGWQNIVCPLIFGAVFKNALPESVVAVIVPIHAICLPSSRPSEKLESDANQLTTLLIAVTHCADMGEYYLVESLLADKSRFTFHLALNEKPQIGEKLNLTIALSLLIPLS